MVAGERRHMGFAPSAAAPHVTWMSSVGSPGTPKRLDRVGVLKVGRAKARNVLVF